MRRLEKGRNRVTSAKISVACMVHKDDYEGRSGLVLLCSQFFLLFNPSDAKPMTYEYRPMYAAKNNYS